MATGTKTPRDEDYYNRTQDLYNREFNGNATAKKDQNDAFENEFGGKNFDQTADTSGSDILAQKARAQEQNPDTPNTGGFYRPNGSRRKQKKTTFKTILKKKGPLAAIITLLIGGGGALSMMFAPALGIINLKEVLFNDLNDQFAAVDVRSMHVLKTRLKSIQKGASICSDAVQIRCKFSTFNKKQVKAFRDAGFTIESESKSFGREAVTKLSFTDPSTGVVTDFSDPNKLIQEVKRNSNLRKALMRAYNPKYYSLKDAVAKRFTGSKEKRLKGTSTEELDKSMNKSIKESSGHYGSVTAEKSKKTTDSDGNKTTTPDVPEVKGGGVGSIFANGAKGVGVIGALDSACTVRSTSKAVQASAKVIRAAQMAAFAMTIFNFADSVKAGDATWEEAQYIGDKFAATDTQKQIINETSPLENNVPQEVANPYYGKSGYDAPGVKVAMYNDTPTLTARDQQYTVGGGLVGTLSVVNTAIDKVIGPVGSDTCKFVQNPFVRITSGGVGLVLGAFSGGASLAISIGASLAISAALPILQTYLSDMIAGTTVNADTKGVDAGNALFAGSGVMLGDMAKVRGMKPATVEELKNYQAVAQKAQDSYVAYETDLAKSEPLNVMNQYSFLGSLARTINPTILASSSNMTAAITTMPSLFSTAMASIIPATHATSQFNPARFEQCQDPAYAELGIDADVFCNVRYVMSDRELAMDTDEALDYMLSHNYIDNSGAPLGDYSNWMTECVNRQNGWGEQEQEEGDTMTGAACMKDTYGSTSADVAYFRVFTMDTTLNNGMDDENEDQLTAAATAAPTTGDARSYAQQIIDSGHVTAWSGDPDDNDGPSDEMTQIQNMANGTASKECLVDTRLLKMIASLSKNHTLVISDLNRTCSKSSIAYSSGGHYDSPSRAVDFDKVDGDDNPETNITLIDEALSYVDSGNAVWVGQINERPGGSLTAPSGVRVNEFDDYKGHLHLAID